MFSTTTIESSTTRPTEMVMAPRVKMLSEYPAACMPMKVSRIEVGIEMAVTSVDRTDSKKMRMMMTAKMRPSVPSTASASIELSMNGA